MDWTDTALVLHVGKFKESDLWVRLLTFEHGAITAFAFGGSRSRRRFTGCLDVFNLIRVSISSKRNSTYIIMREAILLEGPTRLRQDWRRQGYAANCIRFVEALGIPPDSSQTSFVLVREMLSLLEHHVSIPEAMPLLFRFRMATDHGYVPDLRFCSVCGKILAGLKAVFIVQHGQCLCPACGVNISFGLSIDAAALDVLTKVQEYSPKLWAAFDVSADAWRQCARVIDNFVRYHLDLEWRNGRFLRVGNREF